MAIQNSVRRTLAKPIADAMHRHEVLWLGGIVVQLPAQCRDGLIHRAGHETRPAAPHFLEQLFARECLGDVLVKMDKEFEFHTAQPSFAVRRFDTPGVAMDERRPHPEDCRHGGHAPNHNGPPIESFSENLHEDQRVELKKESCITL